MAIKIQGTTIVDDNQGLRITGVSTFTTAAGPVLIGGGTSTGTASQPLQVTGGAYVSGILGVGHTNPAQKLEVVGNVNITGIVTANTFTSTVATGTAPLTVTSTTQVNNLNVQYLNGLSSATTGANTIVRTDASGNIAASGNVTAYSSDRRLKENFQYIQSPLEKIQKLNGYTFDWNETSKELNFIPKHKTNDIGLIAQEVEEVFPQAVDLAPFDRDYDENGTPTSKSGENYLTIQYERLVPLLVESIKEQQKEIDNLKNRIMDLEDK